MPEFKNVEDLVPGDKFVHPNNMDCQLVVTGVTVDEKLVGVTCRTAVAKTRTAAVDEYGGGSRSEHVVAWWIRHCPPIGFWLARRYLRSRYPYSR